MRVKRLHKSEGFLFEMFVHLSRILRVYLGFHQVELGRFLSILITEMPNLNDKTRYLCSLFESSVNSRMTF